jgi:uncharacterized lipoprotein
MNNIIKIGMIIIAGSLIAACGSGRKISVSSQNTKYLNAGSIPTLKMPPGVKQPKYASRYPIPKKHYNEKGASINIVPPGIAAY